MKTIKKQLKAMLLIMMLMISATFQGQTETKNKRSFVRVYNLDGKKINKGFAVKVSDSTLFIKRNNKLSELNWNEIGFIKTKRSGGNNILIGSLIGASTGAILVGAATADSDAWIPYTPAEGAVVGGIYGSVSGAAIGALTIPFKNIETFVINGDLGSWSLFKEKFGYK